MFGTSKRNAWQAIAGALVVALGAAWMPAPSNLAAPSAEALTMTMGGACIIPSFDCNSPDHCANDNLHQTSIYYNYWGSHSGYSSTNTGLLCLQSTNYDVLNCASGGTGPFPHFACS